jgi:hypothetical protein
LPDKNTNLENRKSEKGEKEAVSDNPSRKGFLMARFVISFFFVIPIGLRLGGVRFLAALRGSGCST